MVDRLWNEWQQVRAQTELLAEQQNPSVDLIQRQDAALSRLMTVEEALEARLSLCNDQLLVARVSLEIAIRRAEVNGEDLEPHWQLVQAALNSVRAMGS